MASSLERLVTAGLWASNESRRQIEAAVGRLLDAPVDRRHRYADGAPHRQAEGTVGGVLGEILSRGIDASEGVGEIVQREVARQADFIAERIDELEARVQAIVTTNEMPLAGKSPSREEPGSENTHNGGKSKKTTNLENSTDSERSKSSESKSRKSQKSKKSTKASGSKSKKSAKAKEPRKAKKKAKRQSSAKSAKSGAKSKKAGVTGRARNPTSGTPRRRDPVGTSGVHHVATTRAAREGE